MPPAPGRLSMMICFPQISVRRAATVRAMTSFDAPGVNPTIHRIGFEGNPDAGSGCAAAMPAVAQYNDNASHAAFIETLRADHCVWNDLLPRAVGSAAARSMRRITIWNLCRTIGWGRGSVNRARVARINDALHKVRSGGSSGRHVPPVTQL